MRSHRVLLSLLLCVTFDAALPYEPAARGGYQLEVEDQDEEVVRAERRRAERPAGVRQQRPPAPQTNTSGRVALAANAARAGAAAAEAPERAAPPRARIHAPDPASPAEDH